MFRKIFVFAFILIFAQFAWSTTYFKNWVNQSESDTLTQGDFYAWEFDVSVPGGSALIQLYVDANSNQTLDADDVLLIEFLQQDGVTSADSPGDSSAVPDGIIYTNMGPFGFAPADYLFKVTDQNDQSTVTGRLHINAADSVKVWIVGKVTIENVQAPNGRLANFMFEAADDSNKIGIRSGLTDEYGNFRINLPDYAEGMSLKIGFMFEQQIANYLPDSVSYHNVKIVKGENAGFNFHLKQPKAWVYGSVKDENGQVVPISGYGELENLMGSMVKSFLVSNGTFNVGAPFAPDQSTNVPFHIMVWSEQLSPDYMIPDYWSDTTYTFNMSIGDSIQKDIHVRKTNASIYVVAKMDGQPLGSNFKVWAQNFEMGQSYVTLTDTLVELRVVDGYYYNIRLAGSEGSQPPIPAGYYVVGGIYRQAMPGDTVYFFLEKAQSQISGRIVLLDSVPYLNPDEFQIMAFTPDFSRQFTGVIDWDFMNFNIALPNGTYNIQLNNWSNDFLVLPAEYKNITVNDSQVDTLEFKINFRHAVIRVKLHNLPADSMMSTSIHAATPGQYPWIYELYASIDPDSSFNLRVCDGDWIVYAPNYWSTFQPDKDSVVVHVTDDSAYYSVDFYYQPTGIEHKITIPTTFYVKQNYPNPFNPQTTIEFGLPRTERVTIDIFNINGQKVQRLRDAVFTAGVHRLRWNASGFASGVYFVKVSTKSKTVIKRMLLIK